MSETKIFDKILIDDYILLETIGKGTFGKVKLGIHKPTKQEVAVKIFEKKNFTSSKDLLYFKKEISILKKLNHPNIIKIYNKIEDNSNYYIIMEYASKGELFKYIVNKKRIDENEAAYFYCQLIHGLEFIHQNNISHRDLKPENLLIKDNNILAISDFGLSTEYNNNQLLCTPCGSPSYAAPEMILGKKYNGLNIDIWSSGITLYAMVCGKLPFKDKNQEKLYKKILTFNYELPNYLSNNCKDLIKKILCNEKNRININKIKNHPFLKDSFSRYNPNEYILYNSNKIYNKIIEIMVNNLPEYTYNKEEIIYSIKNKKFNNITTTYELLLKKMFQKENENKSNFLFTKSSTDSCVTTNNVSNLVNKCIYPSNEDKKKANMKIFENTNKNTDSNENKKLNNDKNQASLSLSIQTKRDSINKSNENNKIYSYYTQNNQQKIIINKNKVNEALYERTNAKKENNKYWDITKNLIPKFELNNNNQNIIDFDFSILNSNSSREIKKCKKEMENKSDDISTTINNKKNVKNLSKGLSEHFSHNQNMLSNDIFNYNNNLLGINEFENEKNKNTKKKKESLSILFPQSKNKSKKENKNINCLNNYFMKNYNTNKFELDNSNISNENYKMSSNLQRIKNLNKIKRQKINTEYNFEGKLKADLIQDSLNNIQISLPKTNNFTQQNFLKINNFKENIFIKKCCQSPPSVYLKINKEKNKIKNIEKKQIQINNFESNIKRNKSKSVHKKLVLNSSNKKMNTENIFFKYENKKNILIQKNNKFEKNNKSNPKTYNSVYRQKSINESSCIIKISKNQKNFKRRNKKILAFNPFTKSVITNNKKNVKSISNIYSNNNNNNNLSISLNNNINSKNSKKPIREKQLFKFKTLSDKTLNYPYNYKNDKKKEEPSSSNNNLIKFKTEEINYNNPNNESYCSDSYILQKKYKKSKEKEKYNKNTYELDSNDFAVCNTNSSLEEISNKLNELSKKLNFNLTKIDITNYVCIKNKNNTIKIEISSKGNINMLKIYYLEGKESVTKEMIKSIIFSIGF